MTELKKLNRKMAKIEKEFDTVNTKAVVIKARLLKKARSIEKRINKIKGID